MYKWMIGLIDRMFALFGAIACSQFPLFMQQYVKQLEGHAAELQHQVESLQIASAMTGKSLSQYVNKFLESGDGDFVLQGEIMQRMIERSHHFSQALIKLNEAPIYLKPMVFFQHLDLQIMKSTSRSFEMGIPLSLEGGAYALLGLFAGYGVFYILRSLIGLLVKKRLKKAASSICSLKELGKRKID